MTDGLSAKVLQDAIDKVMSREWTSGLAPVHPDVYRRAQQILRTDQPLTEGDLVRAVQIDIWTCEARDQGLPEDYVLDPAIPEHRPQDGIWWVITPDGKRTAWNNTRANGEEPLICPVCHADKNKMPDCTECKGRGVVDDVPYAPRPWDEVAPGLWLGGHGCQMSGAPPFGECYLDMKDAPKFDMVVSLVRHEHPRFVPAKGVEHIQYRMADADLDPEHHTHLDDIADRIYMAVEHNKRVLVRCMAGLNRSALVVGLVMIRLGWTAEDAITHMRRTRSPYVLFNGSFVEHLRRTEKKLREVGVL